MGAAGGAGSIAVTTESGCSWTGSSAASWITATGGTSASGPGTFTFNVASLSGTASRTGSLNVAGQTVSVTQQGQSCTYTLQPASRTIGAAGATWSFDVNTNAACSWTVATTAPWLSVVAGGSGSGNATVTYQAAANPDAASRTGSLTLA
ncbi:MAG: BACON domain-containing carbohydrate-binding protein, partial [Vicinamibacterales bacterium]